jgi:hypothetical protein
MVRVLAFDIGIKNLAWCCLEKTGQTYTILGWDNYNLLSDESNVGATAKVKCVQCSLKAGYVKGEQTFCGRHCPAATPALRDLSGNLLKKVPSVEGIRTILTARGLVSVPKKKAQVIEELEKLYSLPIQSKKVSKAPDAGLQEIHTSIQALVRQHATLWGSCSTILLENQPAFKNPTMKSVQMLLFATLRDLLQQPPPQLKLVHAGKKVQGAAKGDAGYKDRKAGSESRADSFLTQQTLQTPSAWQRLWAAAKKKSDLADALAMCIDAVDA